VGSNPTPCTNQFSILVVAVDPSFFNNNQQVRLQFAFLGQALVLVAGWLWRNPQADAHMLISFLRRYMPLGFVFSFFLVYFDFYVVKVGYEALEVFFDFG
jgi:hypothetical protein